MTTLFDWVRQSHDFTTVAPFIDIPVNGPVRSGYINTKTGEYLTAKPYGRPYWFFTHTKSLYVAVSWFAFRVIRWRRLQTWLWAYGQYRNARVTALNQLEKP